MRVSGGARRAILLGLLIGIIGIGGARPQAQAPAIAAAFHGVGDLPGGGVSSEIRDATRVGSQIYGVGSATARATCSPMPCLIQNRDTAVLWTWTGAAGSLTALPNLVVNNAATNFMTASAITPNGAYIASRARSVAPTVANPAPGDTQAVRVTNALVPFPSANLNLSAFTPALSASTNATAISSDGSILYGNSGALGRVVRFDTGTSTDTLVPLLPGDTRNTMAARGTSADGSVAVGSSFSSGANHKAFRYVHGSGVFQIPALPGQTTNDAIALTSDGRLVLVVSSSADYPNGEAYIYDAVTSGITRLGSPSTSWAPGNLAGITSDGSVVAMLFTYPGASNDSDSYFHNSHGWFLLTNALADAPEQIDVRSQGWQDLRVTGISGDGTLVFGSGTHNGNIEGFVAEFPAGYLAGYNPHAAPPADMSIVGVWAAAASPTVAPDTANPPAVVAFMADGTYYEIEASGFERGLYSFADGKLRVWPLQDTNARDGLSDSAGSVLPITINGDELTGPTGCTPGTNCDAWGARISGSPGSIAGGWVIGDPSQADQSTILIVAPSATSTAKFFMAQDGVNDAGGHDGIEIGVLSWDPSTHVITTTKPFAVDTNGDWGLSNPTGDITATLAPDGHGLIAGDSAGTFLLRSVIDPAPYQTTITSTLSATARIASAFSYAITASNAAFMFDANGLPNGLTVDKSTGVISGAATALGTYPVDITASNSLSSATATLSIQVVCTAGSYQANPTDLLCTPADAGYYVPADGATAQLPCPTGLSSDAGATACDDRTPPVIVGTPANITTPATGPSGATVTYTAPTAIDSYDGVVPVTCLPASGSLFAKGTTKVTCTTSDAAGHVTTSAFYVTIGAESAPVISGAPFTLSNVQATGPGGAVVIYPSITALDAWGGALPVICTPASGSLLPLGLTRGTCTASDVNGISSSAAFSVTVVDTLAPSWVTFPASITVEAASSKGTVVSYVTPTVADLVDPAPTMKCDKPSGQTFPIGTTTVNCTAADHSGNSIVGSFTVKVQDTTAPSVAINKPVDGAIYKLNGKLAANYACADAGAGMLTCDGMVVANFGLGTVTHVVSGGAIDTSLAGTYQFTVYARDNADQVTIKTIVFTIR